MDKQDFEEIFNQIKINFWLIGIPFNEPKLTIRYIILLFTILTVALAEAAFFYSKLSVENLLELTQLAPCTCIGLLSILKIIFITIKRQNIFQLTACLKRLYEDTINSANKWELIKKDIIFLKYLVKYFFILNAILIVVYNFSSLILIWYNYYTKGVIIYSLPYAVLVPFLKDCWYTWLYKYIHLIMSGFICVLYFTTVDALYYIMTSHLCSQFAILSDELRSLDENTTHCLRDIVIKHQYILKLSQDLEEIFRAPNLLNVLVGSLEICALGFSLTMGNWAQIPGVILFLASVFVQILMISVFGEKLIRESRKIGESAFLCKWYKMDKKSKNTILLLMLRSNKPQKLTAYKFSVISYESFTKIISTSWSYFTILKTVYTPPDTSYYE
ncbi:odorant receptor 13a-like [Nymphalis io]|uniref:odorant receptor 13a-like n=1 Tax=Inachis io TaxID=171585 RepID=UPI002168FDE5|nr:odorant receptor 13a-like [Nymphalis io]